jgi:acetolactate synthase I/II/III large subunit
MAAVSGGELVVRTLVKEGVKRVYLLYGGHLQPICEAIREHAVKYVDMRHEVTAGYAAQGFSRGAGDIGVAMVSAAPGFTNVLSSVTNAYIDRTPVIYISTSAHSRDAGTNNFMSGIDPVAMVRPVTKWAHCATCTADIPRLLAHAIRVATTAPTGPVLLDLPWDVVFGLVEDDTAVRIPDTIRRAGAPLPPPDAIDAALRLLQSAERPVILVGEGAVGKEVADGLRSFVGTTGIPVFTSYDGIGLLPADHAAFGGTLLKLTEFRDPARSPDAVLALGIRFGFMTAGAAGIVPPGTKLIHVDTDAIEIGRVRDVAIGIAAGGRETLSALNAGASALAWRDLRAWRETLQLAKQRRLEKVLAAAHGRQVPIPPFTAAQAIVETAGPNAIFVVDGADAHMWIAEAAQQQNGRNRPGRFFAHSGFFGCLGYGVGFAMGVHNANPAERVVCVIGDGALGLTLAELHTLARHAMPIVVVVMNNRAWGATSHYQDTAVFGRQGKYFATDLSGAAYHDVAIALGCHGALVTRPEQLVPALKSAFASGRPACVNVEIAVEDIAPDHLALSFLRK